MKTTLVDARNFDVVKIQIMKQLAAAAYVGFDIETHDAEAHAGIREYRKKDSVKVFDSNRTTVTGFSLYTPGAENAWYVNLAHADVENRIPWVHARRILDAKPSHIPFIIHNKPFEQCMLFKSLQYSIGKAICSLQLAVSCFGPDEYDPVKLGHLYQWPVVKLIPEVIREFRSYDPNVSRELNSRQADLLAKVVGKESKAAWAYNGFVGSICFGYGLKKLTKSLFGVDMITFKECLGDKEHMGQLTGEEVAAYGGDDAYWAVRVFEELLTRIRPEALQAFSDTENPMTDVYADIWIDGLRIDLDAVNRRKIEEEQNKADVRRKLKGLIQSALPFPAEPNSELIVREPKWYGKNWESWREKVARFDDELNPTYYMVVRTILYDLLGLPIVFDQGKIASDGEARGKILDHADARGREIIKTINELASIDQRIKLYLKPYPLLTDPETQHIYPVVSSRLATRRMAASFPNSMQLAKRGDSQYIRGFYLPDEDDHLIVSLDWSQIELVLIGEFSGDPKFREAYGQLPYRDLHKYAAVAVLSAIENQDITVEDFDKLRTGVNPFNFALIDERGMPLDPKAAYKFNRSTMGGKGASFEFWYSGSLSNLATRRNLPPHKMRALVEAYERQFPVGCQWRRDLIRSAQESGYVELPDGHRRVKYEATAAWQNILQNYFFQVADSLEDTDDRRAVDHFARQVIYKIQRRAGNQSVNALVQGTCATLAKRTILRLRDQLGRLRARFLMPIHDELVFSVHRDDVIPFIHLAKRIMADHGDIIKTLKVHSTASVGRTFQPWDPVKAPFGQVELDEAPEAPFIAPEFFGKAMNDNAIEAVIRELAA